MEKKRVIRASIVMLGLVVLLTGVALGNNSYVKIEDDPIALSGTEETGTVLVKQTADDLNVIPDKYNTGAKGKLEKVALGAKIGEIMIFLLIRLHNIVLIKQNGKFVLCLIIANFLK